MAYKMPLKNPLHGMSFIWNVDQHVGDSPSCANDPNDVDLVTMLVGAWMLAVQPVIHPSLKHPFEFNGQMNLKKAYWIRAANSQHTQKLSFREAGIVSPAKANGTYGSHLWTIVRLNLTMRKHLPVGWERLPDHPQCPPKLRQALVNGA